MSRGGKRGGRGGGRGGGHSGSYTIGGTAVDWDLTGLEIVRKPSERWPKAPPPPDREATAFEKGAIYEYLTVLDRIHDGPFYTVLNDGMKNGHKQRTGEKNPTEESLFNPFTDNETYSSRYLRTYRKLPQLDAHPFVEKFFAAELRPYVNGGKSGQPNKKRRIAPTNKLNAVNQIERIILQEQDRAKDAEDREGDDYDDAEGSPGSGEEDEEADDKPDAVNEEDDWSAVSSDSEESGDDYNAEQYFDNGENEDIDDDDPYANTFE